MLISESVPIIVLYVPDACLASNAVCNPSTLEITWLCESSATAAVIVMSEEPLNSALPDRSPPKLIVLAVANVVAVDAFPDKAPTNVAA